LTQWDDLDYDWSAFTIPFTDRLKIMKRLFIYHLPAIFYAAAILFVSTVPDLKSPEVRFLAFDKVAHFMEYGLFAFLLARSVGDIFRLKKNRSNYTYFICLGIIVIFAAMDELLQRSVQGRFADGLDYLSDIGGSGLVLLLLWFRNTMKSRSKKAISKE